MSQQFILPYSMIFWMSAQMAEVPIFSDRHFRNWWVNWEWSEVLLTTIGVAVICCSVTGMMRVIKKSRFSDDV